MSNSTQPETPRMLTPKDVAQILGVHQKTVHLWLRTGKLKGIKISYRAWRIPASALEEFIAEKSNGSPLSGTDESNAGSGVPPALQPAAGTAVIQDTPREKMKQYIRDIMGEQALEKEQPPDQY